MLTLIVIFLLVAVDRLSKVLLSAYLADKDLIVLIPKVLGLRLLEGGNTGAAFGIFEGSTFFLVVLTAVVLVVLLYALLFKKFKSPVLKWAVVLIVAGGIGNLYDRIAFGYVTDFFEFLFIRFPIFNVADCFISVGVALAVLYLLFTFKDDAIFVKAPAEDAHAPSTDKQEGSDSKRDAANETASDAEKNAEAVTIDPPASNPDAGDAADDGVKPASGLDADDDKPVADGGHV